MPFIDPNWLVNRIKFVQNNAPNTPADKVAQAVEALLLCTDLSDFGMHGTGFPVHIGLPGSYTRLEDRPILVEVVSMMEIGPRASPEAIEEMRLKRARQALLEQRMQVPTSESKLTDDEFQYARDTLQLVLSDGATDLTAIEHYRVHQISLGRTPIGTKLFLHGVRVIAGVLHIGAGNVELLGGESSSRQDDVSFEFAAALSRRFIQDASIKRRINDVAGIQDRLPDSLIGHIGLGI
ncbi:hypothetical protein BKA70DRAFT_1210618 [Coprinopsis sp. MPI-PUGE-AT-0042]|nr:hypothetical protein BKA70DRAFT_1210618 [Coprinopsis sp. MPI-PUGE-AT-0042]